MTIFALIGSGIEVADGEKLGLSLVLLFIALMISAYLYRQHKKEKAHKPCP